MKEPRRQLRLVPRLLSEPRRVQSLYGPMLNDKRAVRLAAALTLALACSDTPDPPPGAADPPDPRLDALPRAAFTVDSQRREIVIELPALDLPPGGVHREVMVRTPVCRVDVPLSVSLHQARVAVVDSAGRELPQTMLHHFNISDPDRRELFLPIALHILAASKETPAPSVPRLLIGLPLARGQRLITSAMLANSTPVAYGRVSVRLLLRYVPGDRPWPLFRAYPWVMDVMFPLGRLPDGNKAFDLPPGRTVRFWESSPALPGTILGLGGHLHDYGTSIELRDMTTGESIWQTAPVTDASGRVTSIPLKRFYRWNRLGVHIVPDHRYRLTVVYDNPTGATIHDGGMGAAAGLFVPDRGAVWPAVDTSDSVYRQDLASTLSPSDEGDMMVHEHP